MHASYHLKGNHMTSWELRLVQVSHISMNGSMESNVCGLSFNLNGDKTHPETYFSKATNYALMIISLTFLQVIPASLKCTSK